MISRDNEPVVAEALNLHLLRSLFLHFEVESNDTIDHDKAKIYVLSLSSFSLISMENEVDSLAECCNRKEYLNGNFFKALSHVQEIHANCKVLLRTHDQNELMSAYAGEDSSTSASYG
ncbi:hypothetical protein JHK82_055847 [Glycine max]|nr:hypothetical protein JHK84_055713 [Glycine max]KAG5077152.1 hypothetical protein JHK82_055847 [Glycine max]